MIKEAKTGIYTRTTNGITTENEFNFYVDLSAINKLKFVRGVINAVVDGGYYNSIILDMIIKFQIVNIFTDVDISEITESSNNVDEIETFIEETNISDIVIANMKEGLMDELIDSINKNIEYKTGIHRSLLDEAIANMINEFSKVVKDLDTDSLMEVAKKFNENTGELTPERMLEAYANTDYLKNKIAHDLEEKHKKESGE